MAYACLASDLEFLDDVTERYSVARPGSSKRHFYFFSYLTLHTLEKASAMHRAWPWHTDARL